jgi:acetyl esterase/lipase
MDISIPGGAACGGVILFIHGGTWMYGGKENYPIFLDLYRDRFIVASMNHRYIDEHTHADNLVDDVAAAVLYIREFSSRNNTEAGKLVIMGHSSGAHLAMLYAYKQKKAAPIPIAFCVDMAGPADLGDIAFLYNFKKLKAEKLFHRVAEKITGRRIADGDISGEGYSESLRETIDHISPIRFVTADSPPTIIIHDAADILVPYSNSAALNSVFNVYGVDHYFMASYSGIGHFLGIKITRGGALRYDKTLVSWIVRVMDEYIEKYCR